MNNLLYFIDNIEAVLEKEKMYLVKELQSHITDEMEVKPDFKEGEQTFALGDDTFSYQCIRINVEPDTSDNEIEAVLKKEILPIIKSYDTVQLAIDRNLNREDTQNTSVKLICKLYSFLRDQIINNQLILSVVSSYFYTDKQTVSETKEFDDILASKVKFFARPVNNNKNIYEWDVTESTTGQYNVGNKLYDKYADKKKYRIIEDLLYSDTVSANYFGLLLVRFLKDPDIEQLL